MKYKDFIFLLKWITSPVWGLILLIAWLLYFKRAMGEKDNLIATQKQTIESKEYWIEHGEQYLNEIKEEEEKPEILASYSKSLIKKGNRVYMNESRNIETDMNEILEGRMNLNAWYNG